MQKDLNKIQLPKINERKQQSRSMQNTLEAELFQMIKEFEKQNGYKFEPYEVDNILLGMVKKNHESYLNSRFGYDTV